MVVYKDERAGGARAERRSKTYLVRREGILLQKDAMGEMQRQEVLLGTREASAPGPCSPVRPRVFKMPGAQDNGGGVTILNESGKGLVLHCWSSAGVRADCASQGLPTSDRLGETGSDVGTAGSMARAVG